MSPINKRTVVKVRDAGFCLGCGMCEIVCPVNAIEIIYSEDRGQYIPFINNIKCTKCRLCLSVCPGDDINHPKLSEIVHRKQPENPYIGVYKKIMIASSTNDEYRQKGASGGFITQLLANLLNAKAVDAVLVAGMEDGKLNMAQTYLLRDTYNLGKYQRSIYTNVHWAEPLHEIQQLRLRTAVVGLPCHLHALNKIIQIKPELREYIRFSIGLFCGGTYNGKAVINKLKDMLVSPENVKRIDYRWGSWPGKMKVSTKDGNDYYVTRDEYFKSGYLKRCYYCFDFLADLADVSVGDNWCKDSDGAENIIVVRKTKVLPYLENMNLKEASENDLIMSHNLKSYRQRFSEVNAKVSKFFGNSVPNIKPYAGIKYKLKHYINAVIEYMTFHMDDLHIGTKGRFFKLKGYFFHFVMKPDSKKRDK